MDVTLYWLTQDLRVDDNAALVAAANSRTLLCVHCTDSRWFHPYRYHVASMGPHRWRFLQQALDDLEAALASRNQRLVREHGVPEQVLAALVHQHKVTRLVCSRQTGSDELAVLGYLQTMFPALQIQQVDNNTLFARDQLPQSLARMADGFTAFRQLAAQQPPLAPIQAPESLPPPALQLVKDPAVLKQTPPAPAAPPLFHGGEQAARAQLKRWLAHMGALSSANISNEYGNALDTSPDAVMSPWLSQGSISMRRLLAAAQHAPIAPGLAGQLYDKLLYREYQHWLALFMGKQLFSARGLTGKAPLACGVHPERYQKWCNGTTPWPLINACMRQLRQTGYLSTPGRQIVAECFVHELSLDWRYGAAWFEYMLVDYDVANNWLHWQNAAGVGADRRSHPSFDVDKLTTRYDATGEYRRRWAPKLAQRPLDSVDAADWPIDP